MTGSHYSPAVSLVASAVAAAPAAAVVESDLASLRGAVFVLLAGLLGVMGRVVVALGELALAYLRERQRALEPPVARPPKLPRSSALSQTIDDIRETR